MTLVNSYFNNDNDLLSVKKIDFEYMRIDFNHYFLNN